MPRRNLVIAGSALLALVLIACIVIFARHQKSSNPTPTATCTPTHLAVASRTPVPRVSPVTTVTPICTPTVTATDTATVPRRRTSPTATPSPAATKVPTATVPPTSTPHPAFVPGPLDGERVTWDVAHRRPVAIMVENYNPDSRPQTGLSSASVVFETVAESGITRFMPVYLEKIPAVVGPVRSARVYYDSWANGLHAVLVHAGGNDDALKELFTLHNIADVNEVKWEDANYNPTVPFFARTPERAIPHNMYTFPPKVLAYEKTQHVQLNGSFPDLLPHHAPDNIIHRPAGGTLDLAFNSNVSASDPGYNVEYQYDRGSDRYLRFMGGVPHLEASSGHQLAPSNVVVLLGSVTPDPKAGDNPGAVYVQSIGKNLAYLFRDGKETKGTWHKSHGGSPLLLLDDHNRPFTFNPGQTWIEVVPSLAGNMTWKPGK
jgi:hypothetical protein